MNAAASAQNRHARQPARAVAGARRRPIACARPASRTEVIVMTTTGDRSQHGSVPGDDSKRQFVKELEDALLRGDADVAVHSAKDLPVELPGGLDRRRLPPARGRPRRRSCSPKLPAGTMTSRRRRTRARLADGRDHRHRQRAPRGAAGTAPCAGHVRSNSRQRRHAAGTSSMPADSTRSCSPAPASAGWASATESRPPIPVDQCVPAPGQGIVATEIRLDDEAARAALVARARRAGRTSAGGRTSSRGGARRRVSIAARRLCQRARRHARPDGRRRVARWDPRRHGSR